MVDEYEELADCIQREFEEDFAAARAGHPMAERKAKMRIDRPVTLNIIHFHNIPASPNFAIENPYAIALKKEKPCKGADDVWYVCVKAGGKKYVLGFTIEYVYPGTHAAYEWLKKKIEAGERVINVYIPENCEAGDRDTYFDGWEKYFD